VSSSIEMRENLANDQCTDAEVGRVVQLRLEADERPTNESTIIRFDSSAAAVRLGNVVDRRKKVL